MTVRAWLFGTEIRSGAAHGGSVATRMRAIFLAILLAGIAASAFALVALQRVVDVVNETTGVVEPLSAASYEMEINLVEIGMGVFKFLHTPDPSHIERIEEDAREFEFFQREFERLASPGAPMTVAAEARRVFDRYRALGLALVADKDAEQALAQDLIQDILNLDLEGTWSDSDRQAVASARAALAVFSTAASARILYLTALSPLDDSIDSDDTATAMGRSRALIDELIARDPTPEDTSAAALALEQALHIADDIALLEATIRRIAADAAEFIRLRRAMDDLLDERLQVYTAALREQARRDSSATLGRAQVGVIVAAILAIGLVAVGTVYVARSVVRPIGLLVEGTERIAQGQADWRVAVTTRDEFGRLAAAFNAMADRIKAHSRGLEDAVAKRTAELAASESRLRTTLENLTEGVVVSDLDGRLLDVNRAAVLMHDFGGPEEYLRLLPEFTDTFELSAPDGTILPLDQWPLARVLRGEILHDLEVNVRRKRNGWRRVFGYGGTIARDADGQPLMAILTIRDLTESKQAEARLIESQSRLRSLAETTPAMLWMTDAERHHTFENQEWRDFFGVEPGAASEHVWREALHPDDQGRVLALYDDVERRRVPYQIECRVRRKDGAWRLIEELGTPRFGPDGAFEGYTRACVDMSERRGLEDQLHRAQKMEAIGQLTGGLAHDFNNILGIMIGNLDLLRLRHATTPEAVAMIDAALNAGTQAAELNRRLLAFARRQPLQPSAVETKGTVESFAKVIGRVVGEHIVVETRVTPDVWPILVDVTQLESAVLNLAINARDAMPNGGQLVIEAVNAHLDGDSAAPRDVAPGEYVKISVSDNGTGMTAEVLARATEPFFTTKGVGKGSGLGLSMVHGFAKQSGGVLRIYSELGVGTTISLYLPRATAAVEISGPRPDDDADITGRGETILVVEDNAGVRDTVCRQLSDLGYRPTPVNSAREALAMLTSGATFDLILTDVVMPGGMDGRELAKVVTAMRPGIRILFTSGFTAAAAGNGEEFKGRLLSKPYRRSELAKAIREILREGKA